MRWCIVLLVVALTGCAALPAQVDQTRATLGTRDIAVNRPNTDRPEALFRMHPDGTGTVDFIANPDGAQDVVWTLLGDQFCIHAREGLMASFDCATLTVRGAQVTFAHARTGSVATGVLVARQP